MSDVLLRQPNGRFCQVDADGPCATPRKSRQIDAGAAADVEHALPRQLVEGNQGEKVMQLVEVILLEILKELGGPRRMRRDRQIVNVLVPVRAHTPDQRARRRCIAG